MIFKFLSNICTQVDYCRTTFVRNNTKAPRLLFRIKYQSNIVCYKQPRAVRGRWGEATSKLVRIIEIPYLEKELEIQVRYLLSDVSGGGRGELEVDE